MNTWLGAFLTLETSVAAIGLLSWKDGIFNHAQMLARYGSSRGLPFINHGGMWGDALIVSPVIATLISRYADHWSTTLIFWCAVIGVLVSMGMHNLYSGSALQNAFPDCLVLPQGVRPGGVLHVGYFAAVFAVLLLFFFCTPDVIPLDAVVVSIAFSAHMGLGVIQPALHVGDKSIWSPDVIGVAGVVWFLLWIAAARIYFFPNLHF